MSSICVDILTPIFKFPSNFNKSEIISICRSNIDGIDLEFVPINEKRIGIVLKDSKFSMESIELVYQENVYLMNQLDRATQSLSLIQENYINDQKLIKNLQKEISILKKIESDLTNRLESQIQIQRESETKTDKLVIQLQQQLTASINIIRSLSHVVPNILEDEEFLTNINCNSNKSSPIPLSPLLQATSISCNNNNNNNNSTPSPQMKPMSISSSSSLSSNSLCNNIIAEDGSTSNNSNSTNSTTTTTTTLSTTTTPPITSQRRSSTFNLSLCPNTVKEIDKIKYLISQYIKNCNTSSIRPYSNRNHYNFKFDSTLISNINNNFAENELSNKLNNIGSGGGSGGSTSLSSLTSTSTSSTSSSSATAISTTSKNRRKRQMVRRNSIHDIKSFICEDEDIDTRCRQCSCFNFNNKGVVEWLCVCGHSNIAHVQLKQNTNKKSTTNNNVNNSGDNNNDDDDNVENDNENDEIDDLPLDQQEIDDNQFE